MKTQNVYIGQHHNPNHGAVYTSINEAVKELLRPMQTGFVMSVTYLPDADRYWIVGLFDPRMNQQETKYNQLFLSSSDAEKHAEKLLARGFPKGMVVFKELTIHKTGPKTIDIKTDEHAQCERHLDAFERALEIGLPVSNYPGMMPVRINRDEVPFSLHLDSGFALIDTRVAGFGANLDSEMNADTLWENVSKAAHLLKQVGEVDIETQPNKWRRLQNQTREFGQRLVGDIPSTGEDVFPVAIVDETGNVLHTLDALPTSEIEALCNGPMLHDGTKFFPTHCEWVKGKIHIICRKGAKSHD